MVSIHPFKAVRPRKDLVSEVASLPYDVVNRAEAEELVKDNPYSYLHIDRSEIDLPQLNNPYADEVYEKANDNLKSFQDKGWLEKEQTNMFYIYELTFRNTTQTGLVVAASVEDYLENKIKKHEFTFLAKEKDRINHMDATDANTSPVFLTYRDEDKVNELIESWKASHDVLYNFDSFYYTNHKVWQIDDEMIIQTLQDIFAENVAELYIADGHHRTESAAKVSQMRKKDGTLSQQGAYILSVLFPVSQLTIYDYNRLVKAPVPDRFIENLTEDFIMHPVNRKYRRTTEKHTIALYLDQQWYHLSPKTVSDDLIKSLDASIVQDDIFNKHFNIENPRDDDRLDFVGGIKGLDVLEKAVDSGEASMAIALYPTEIDDLLTVSDQGETMPPKSTWFEPKLLSGLFVYDLESKQ